jgi:hypothetical protein
VLTSVARRLAARVRCWMFARIATHSAGFSDPTWRALARALSD